MHPQHDQTLPHLPMCVYWGFSSCTQLSEGSNQRDFVLLSQHRLLQAFLLVARFCSDYEPL